MTHMRASTAYGNGGAWTPGEYMSSYYFDFTGNPGEFPQNENNYVHYSVPGTSFNGGSSIAKSEVTGYTISKGEITILGLTTGDVYTASISENVITLKCYFGTTHAYTAVFKK